MSVSRTPRLPFNRAPSGFHVHWPPFVLALLLALLAFWLNQVSVHTPYVDDAGFAHEPDYIVENFDALSFDLQGRPRHRLQAAHMTHYMDDDTTVLTTPIFTSLAPDNRVQVTAQRAQMSADGRHVYFLQNVQIVRHGVAGEAPATLATEYLHVTPDERLLRTDKPITLRQGSTLISADQMRLDDLNKQLTLSGNVVAKYQPID